MEHTLVGALEGEASSELPCLLNRTSSDDMKGKVVSDVPCFLNCISLGDAKSVKAEGCNHSAEWAIADAGDGAAIAPYCGGLSRSPEPAQHNNFDDVDCRRLSEESVPSTRELRSLVARGAHHPTTTSS